MNESLQVLYYVLSGVAVLMVLGGLILQSKVKSALFGNLLALCATILAIVLVIVCYYKAGTLLPVYIALGLGAAVGIFWAVKAKMIDMPQTVALLNGLGGAASAFVAAAALIVAAAAGRNGFTFENVTSGLAIVIGGVTLTGSLIAAGKLARILKPAPKRLPGHTVWTLVLAVLMVASLVLGLLVHPAFYIVLGVLSLLFGVLFVMRVGGADMPITISLLNSLSGVAGGIAGMAVGDPLLVCVGGIVGASGLLLTQNMCKAMNRKLSAILTGATTVSEPKKKAPADAEKAAQTIVSQEMAPAVAVLESKPAEAKSEEQKSAVENQATGKEAVPAVCTFSEKKAVHLLREAKKVILVTGYGMALSQAQADVADLARALKARGADVKFAIHPVAGRMPGHMSVLLCEADVDYEDLYMMEDINPEFASCDLAISVGANDVTNPAANTAEGTPIYGMPVLNLGDAPKRIMCCFDTKPGYAGVPNPLFTDPNTLFLPGDAKLSVKKLHDWLDGAEPEGADEAVQEAGDASSDAETSAAGQAGPETSSADQNPAKSAPEGLTEEEAREILRTAKKVILVTGYGMALSQAQSDVAQLARVLEKNGAEVKFAIHPVAGRMPGHMSVLLCEADVDYEALYMMEDINPEFASCDIAISVGANDVTNPAANTAEGTPIYGMPVLALSDAPKRIMCCFDTKPGYAGVPNPLFTDSNTLFLEGDAKDSVQKILGWLK